MSMTEKIRVFIADDHTVVRSGVRLLLEAERDMVVVGEAVDGEEAVQEVGQTQPDIVLMDIAMPVVNGLEATRRIKEKWPEIMVLILTMHRSDEYFYEVLKAGASGYILKAAETNDLLKAIRVVDRGEVYLYPSMAQKLVRDFLEHVEQAPDHKPALTSREEDVLRLIGEGYDPQAIAEKLVVSESTVYTHRHNLMEKLGFSKRQELMDYARRRGFMKGW